MRVKSDVTKNEFWQAGRKLKRNDRMCKGRFLSLLKGLLKNLKGKWKKEFHGEEDEGKIIENGERPKQNKEKRTHRIW